MKHLSRLMKITNMVIRMERLEKDPFKNYRLRFIKRERDYLTERELGILENTFFKPVGLKRVKDVFLFSCYTGLSYIDIRELVPDQILTGIDGNKWIHTRRAKTNSF